jgi:CRISPR-associated protein Csm3
MKIKKIKKITGEIVVETGLHIGGSSQTMEIGGVDSPIVRNIQNEQPFIPGSSLKGKMRSLLEWEQDEGINASGEPCKCGKCSVCRVFGFAPSGKNADSAKLHVGPTRLSIRDAMLSKESQDLLSSGQEIIEIKYENNINRITAKAMPRNLERVVPGIKFDLEIIYKIIDTGDGGKQDEENFEKVVKKALALIEQDCLGGAGSRGCGKVRFENLKDENNKTIDLAN